MNRKQSHYQDNRAAAAVADMDIGTVVVGTGTGLGKGLLQGTGTGVGTTGTGTEHCWLPCCRLGKLVPQKSTSSAWLF